MNDRLYRSRNERMVAGVAGGVAERFDLDPALVRVLWVVLIFLSGGIFLLLYIAMAVLVPETPDGVDRWAAWGAPGVPGPGAVPGWGSTAGSPPSRAGLRGGLGADTRQAAGSDSPPAPDVRATGFAPPPRRRPPRCRRRGPGRLPLHIAVSTVLGAAAER